MGLVGEEATLPTGPNQASGLMVQGAHPRATRPIRPPSAPEPSAPVGHHGYRHGCPQDSSLVPRDPAGHSPPRACHPSSWWPRMKRLMVGAAAGGLSSGFFPFRPGTCECES
ncbi:ataxin-2-like [Bos indicus x Bos taurus]|uniref:ataxin-2-like n=1 Tax=Bos indicus x Bos taurus TaxID=30522 RepID=UPI000F7D5019|nr:ataxin-2-like [Bos indicus x Bos taurus]